MMAVTRALISCHDKAGLDVLAKGLAELGVELLASGGTAAFLRRQGLRVKTVEEFAGASEQLGGRVKTLHPKIHGGILARRDDPAHVSSVGAEGLIDLVVVNLYPFEEASRRPDARLDEVIEQIDIGGVALLRAAAKNFSHVTVVNQPSQYPTVLDALRQSKGSLPDGLRRELAASTFQLTSAYDRLVAAYLAGTDQAAFGETATLEAKQHQPLRYGENPHQRSSWYVPLNGPASGLSGLVQRQGKPLTYNNLLDLDAAVRCVLELHEPACVIVKHASPCGIAVAPSLAEAYRRAYEADAESAFGGIVAVNRPLDAATASQMVQIFLEIIAAPSMADDAVACFAKKPNLRLLELADPAAGLPAAPSDVRQQLRDWSAAQAGVSPTEWRSVLGGWLVQERDAPTPEASALKVVTTRQPADAEWRDLRFAWIAAKHVRSNAIVLAKDGATVGMGQGQPSRVRAVRLAIQNAGGRGRGAALASDGFFPFPDNVELAAEAGITAIIQPGGSVKDQDVIAAANHAGLAMVFTGVRHFRH